MEFTGIVRKLDGVGRVSIPKKLRESFDLTASEDALEIYTDGDKIILKKYDFGCHFCGEVINLTRIGNKQVCPVCLEHLLESQEPECMDKVATG